MQEPENYAQALRDELAGYESVVAGTKAGDPEVAKGRAAEVKAELKRIDADVKAPKDEVAA